MEPETSDSGSRNITIHNTIQGQEAALFHGWSTEMAAFELTFTALEWEPWLQAVVVGG